MPTCRRTTSLSSLSGTPAKIRIWQQSITNGRPNLTGLDSGAVATFTAPPALRSINPRCASLRMTATSVDTFSSLLIFITGLQYLRYRKNGRCRTHWLVVRHRRLEDGIRALSAQATLGRDSFDRILFELRTALERLLRNTRKEFIS